MRWVFFPSLSFFPLDDSSDATLVVLFVVVMGKS